LNARRYLREVSLKRDKIPDYNSYPFSIAAVRKLQTLKFQPDVTFFVGENGTGKSTLLEAIAIALGFNAEGGTKNFAFSTRASHSELHQYLSIVRSFRRPLDGFFLRAESFFNVASDIERMDREPSATSKIIKAYGGRSLHEQSHGESFLALMTQRFRGNGLYILDEPEAALSPSRQLSVITRIHDLVNEKSQFIIATHSPILMAYPDAYIYSFSEKGIERIEYTETEHYRITRDFLANPQRMLRFLMEP